MLILSELLSISDFDFIKQARDTFLAVDNSALGEVTYQDLANTMKQVNDNFSDEQIQKVFENVDSDGSKTLSYSEWLCALVFCDQLTLKNITKLFKFLDIKR